MASSAFADEPVASETLLGHSPWISPRAAALGGGLSPLADGFDSPYYNPATIGGLQPKKEKRFIRAVDFPFFGMAMNENSMELQRELGPQGFSMEDPAIKETVLEAHTGERQYARMSFVPKIGLSRMLFTYNYDVQMAATNMGAPDHNIDTLYRVTQGPGFGLSAVSRDETLYLGFFSTLNTRKETKGVFTFDEINDPTTRSSVLGAASTTYQGTAHNVGMLWRLGKKAMPTLAVVARDVGDTIYQVKKGDGEEQTDLQDLTLGFSVSPQLGKWGHLHMMVEGSRLSNDDVTLQKKLRCGFELTFGERYGSDSILAIRLGGNSAGASYGLGLNLSLINLQIASYAEDIGIKNQRVIERRTAGIVRINVAEY